MRAEPMIRQALFALLLALTCIGAAGAKTCAVTGAWVAFGVYDRTAASLTTGSVVVHCDERFQAVIRLSVGNGAGASYSSGRKMTRSAGGGTLTYNLYADAALSQVFGDGTGGSVAKDIEATSDFTQPIWARIPGNQLTVLPGSYVDIVVVTISY